MKLKYLIKLTKHNLANKNNDAIQKAFSSNFEED